MHKPNSIFEAAHSVLGGVRYDEEWADVLSRKLDVIAKEFGTDDLYLDVAEMMNDLGTASIRSYAESTINDKVHEYRHEKFFNRLVAKVNKAFGYKIR